MQERRIERKEEHGAAADSSSLFDHSRGPSVNPLPEALEMLSLFQSVGVSAFDVTLTTLHGEKVRFRGNCEGEALKGKLEALLPYAHAHHLNIIVRPIVRSEVASLVQLDDLSLEKVARVKEFSFVILETSQGSYQAWMAVENIDSETVRHLKRGVGADKNASGATRLSE